MAQSGPDSTPIDAVQVRISERFREYQWPTQMRVVCAVVMIYSTHLCQHETLYGTSCNERGLLTEATTVRTSSMPTVTFFMCLDVTRTKTATNVKTEKTMAQV
jgi:hypothetical protein